MNPGSDLLSQVAETLRLRGSVSFVVSPASPWGYSVGKSEHETLLVITRGRAYLEMPEENPQAVELAPGDVVGIGHGHEYAVRDSPDTPLRVFVPPRKPTAADRPAGTTEVVGLCCELAGGHGNPLLRVLPPFIHCQGSDMRVAQWLEPTVRLIASESRSSHPGRLIILDRLAEIAFMQLIRAWLEAQPPKEGGWLRALADRRLFLALEAIHTDPGRAWTVASLAERAGMSRSAFATRFKSVVGEPPLEYLTRWRIQLATTLLESGEVPLKQIVASSGYASEAAFRTVFKKWIGESPGSYRNRKRDAAKRGLVVRPN